MDPVVLLAAVLCIVLAFLLGRATHPQRGARGGEQELVARFESAATQALTSQHELFMQTATAQLGPLIQGAQRDFTTGQEQVRQLVTPLTVELKRMETSRAESQGGLKQQLQDLNKYSRELVTETRNLASALSRPEGRGAWGEMQLRRVVELGGMSPHCDFSEQVSVTTAAGTQERPDMVIHLPNDRHIVVDAKAPLQAYLQGMESSSPEARQEALSQVARQIDARIQELSRKSYWESFAHAPDFVIMFLPGEFLLPVALEHDPGLLERSMTRNVLLATPSSLLALLKAVAMGWREVQLAEQAAEIGRMGQVLHDKLYTYAQHVVNTSKALNSTVTHFNRSVASLDGRNSALDIARSMKELGIPTSKDIPLLPAVEAAPVRTPHVAELPPQRDV